MQITKKAYETYATPLYIATTAYCASQLKNYYPGASSTGLFISGIASSAFILLINKAPELTNKKEVRFKLSLTSIAVCIVATPLLIKTLRKIERIMDGYLMLSAQCAIGIYVLSYLEKTFYPPPKYIPPPTPTPPPPKPKKKPVILPKVPPPYSPPKERQPGEADPWARVEAHRQEALRQMEEERRNPPPEDLPGPPPSRPYQGPMSFGVLFGDDEDENLSSSWVKIPTEKDKSNES